MTFLDTPIEDRVSAGIDWLNENGPAEWWDRVDFDTLDITDGDTCVLGQVFAADAQLTGAVNGYAYATGNLLCDISEFGWLPDKVGPLGFLVPWGQERDAIDAWISAIDKIQVEVYA